MFRRWKSFTSLTLLALISIGGWTHSAWAQAPADAALEQRVQALEKEIQLLKQQMLTQLDTQKQLLEAQQGLVDGQAALHQRQQGLIDSQKSLNEANASIRSEQEEHRNLLANQLAQQKELLEAIAGWDESQQPYLRMDNIMASPAGRESISSAVNASLRQQGTITLNNRTAVEQQIFVNRVEYRLPANQAIRLDVPVGTVSTQLPGQEIVNWTITAPTYYQDVDIVEQAIAAPPVQAYYAPTGVPGVWTP